MNINNINMVNYLTGQFYSLKAKEFSDTRKNPWSGWVRMSDMLKEHFSHCSQINLLDVGCGNLRFERFASSIFEHKKIKCVGIDNCPDLSACQNLNGVDFQYVQADIVESLISDSSKDALINNIKVASQTCRLARPNLVVAFGFMHHIPTYNLRLKLLKDLFSVVGERGLVIISFWQFINDSCIASKADYATKRASDIYNIDDLEDGDYFLNWSQDDSVFRFCHHFSEKEISDIVKFAKNEHKMSLVCQFNDDGKNKDLNKYLVFKK